MQIPKLKEKKQTAIVGYQTFYSVSKYLFIDSFFPFFKILFLNIPSTQDGARTQNPKIKSLVFFWLSQPGILIVFLLVEMCF